MEAPAFKFEILSYHKDALSRHLREAYIINEQGKLNRKTEYSSNELIRLKSTTYSWDEEQLKK